MADNNDRRVTARDKDSTPEYSEEALEEAQPVNPISIIQPKRGRVLIGKSDKEWGFVDVEPGSEDQVLTVDERDPLKSGWESRPAIVLVQVDAPGSPVDGLLWLDISGDVVEPPDLPDDRPDYTAVLMTTLTTDTTLNDQYYIVFLDASSGPFNVTLPDPTLYPKLDLEFKKIDRTYNRINFIGVIDGRDDYVITSPMTAVRIRSDGSYWWIMP